MSKPQKLELTWIGKENQPRLEPRILIEDPERSYGDKNSGNMLIHPFIQISTYFRFNEAVKP